MKKFLSLKTLAVFLILALSIVAFAACVKPNDDPPADSTPAYAIPEFSIKIIDGASEYTIGKDDVKTLQFASASRTSKGTTTYYKGFSLSDILAAKNIAREGIFSVTLDDGEYSSDLEATNIGSCVLATVASVTEQGGYVIMTTPENSPEDPEGPIRAVCMADSTAFKSIKNVTNITINRPAYSIPEFSINITDGEDEYTFDQLDAAKLAFESASRTSKGVTTYFKGFSLADVLEAMEISSTGIITITIDDGDYSSDLEAANIATCVLATVSSTEEQGTYAILTTGTEAPEGPVRAVSMAESTEFKSVKNVVNITINRQA